MESGVSRNCVKLLDEGNLGPNCIHLETNQEELWSLLALLGNIVQTNEKFDLRILLSAFSSFHWSLLERRKRKCGNFLSKSRLPGSSVTQENRRRLCLLTPFYLVLSEDYILCHSRDFRVFDLANFF